MKDCAEGSIDEGIEVEEDDWFEEGDDGRMDSFCTRFWGAHSLIGGEVINDEEDEVDEKDEVAEVEVVLDGGALILRGWKGWHRGSPRFLPICCETRL